MTGPVRGSSGAMVRRLPRDRTAWVAILVLLAVTIPLAYLARDERSGMIQMTRPTHGYTSRSIALGHTDLLGDRPFFRENVSFAEQVNLFDGLVPERTDFYFKRPFFAFLAAQVACFVGVLPAFLLVNYACWMVCAWVAWRFTLGVFQDRLAAACAVVFVSGGMGMTAHVGDYSAHMLSFCCCYAGTLLLFESGVWREPRALRTHVALGFVLALAFLSYNSGLMLLAVYLGVAFRHNRLWQLALACVIAFSGQALWRVLLEATGLGLDDVEQDYLTMALGIWRSTLASPLLEATRRILGLLGEFLTFESPGVFLTGVIGLCLLLRRPAELWFFLVLIAVPIAAGMVFGTAAGARGYIVWQISLAFFSASGRLFALGLRGGPSVKVATSVALVAVLSSHFAWSTAHLRGDPGPVKTYHLGLDEGWPLLCHGPSVTLSMTGAEPTPVLFGGEAALVEAGLRVEERSWPVPPESLSWRRSAGMRCLFYSYLAAVCWMLMRPGRARAVVAGLWLVAAVVLPALATHLVEDRPRFVTPHQAFRALDGTRVNYCVQLSEEFLATLRAAMDEDDRLAFKVGVGLGKAVDLGVYAGTSPIPVRWEPEEGMPYLAPAQLCYAEDPAVALEDLSRARQVTFELPAARLASWQRGDLSGRALLARAPAGDALVLETDRLPAAEIRLIRSDRTVEVLGF